MKKNLWIYVITLVVAALAISLASCGGDDEDDDIKESPSAIKKFWSNKTGDVTTTLDLSCYDMFSLLHQDFGTKDYERGCFISGTAKISGNKIYLHATRKTTLYQDKVTEDNQYRRDLTIHYTLGRNVLTISSEYGPAVALQVPPVVTGQNN